MKDFWPISLVGVYKIIFKVLANCLEEVLEKIITNPKMHLYWVGKFWTILIVNECLDNRLNLVTQESYVSWTWRRPTIMVTGIFNFIYLGDVDLGRVRAPGLSISFLINKYIKWCISTAKYSVLVD